MADVSGPPSRCALRRGRRRTDARRDDNFASQLTTFEGGQPARRRIWRFCAVIPRSCRNVPCAASETGSRATIKTATLTFESQPPAKSNLFADVRVEKGADALVVLLAPLLVSIPVEC